MSAPSWPSRYGAYGKSGTERPYAALVAVPTLVASIYGMNFDFMPKLRWRFGYLFAIGTMVGIDAYVFYRLRKAKWL